MNLEQIILEFMLKHGTRKGKELILERLENAERKVQDLEKSRAKIKEGKEVTFRNKSYLETSIKLNTIYKILEDHGKMVVILDDDGNRFLVDKTRLDLVK